VIAVCNGEIDNHHELSGVGGAGRPVQHQTDIAVIPGLYLSLAKHSRVGSSEPLPLPCGTHATAPTLVRDRAVNVRCFMQTTKARSFCD